MGTAVPASLSGKPPCCLCLLLVTCLVESAKSCWESALMQRPQSGYDYKIHDDSSFSCRLCLFPVAVFVRDGKAWGPTLSCGVCCAGARAFGRQGGSFNRVFCLCVPVASPCRWKPSIRGSILDRDWRIDSLGSLSPPLEKSTCAATGLISYSYIFCCHALATSAFHRQAPEDKGPGFVGLASIKSC